MDNELKPYVAHVTSMEEVFECLSEASARGVTITKWTVLQHDFRKMLDAPDVTLNLRVSSKTIAGIPYEVING